MFTTIRKLWSLLLPRERKMAFVLLMIILSSGLASVAMIAAIGPFLILLTDPNALTTNPTIVTIRSILSNPGDRETLLILAGGSLCLIVFGTAMNLLRIYAIARFSHMRAHSISNRIFQLNLKQPFEEFMETRPAVFVRTTVGEPNEVVNQYLMPLGLFISGAITSTMVLSFLLWYNAAVTIGVTLFFFVAFGALSFFTKGQLRKLGEIRIKTTTERGHILQEIVRCFRDIRMSGQETEFMNRFDTTSKKVAQNQMKAKLIQQLPKYWVQFLFFSLVIILSTIFLILSSDNQSVMTYLPTIGIFAVAGQRLLPELQGMYVAKNTMIYGSASVDKLHENYSYLQMNKRNVSTIEQNMPFQQKVVLNAVQYVYRDGTIGLPAPLSTTIPKGQKIGIVGESGAGKSTLLSLLMGLYESSSGHISIDDVPLTKENLHMWRKRVSQVPQEVAILDTNLKSNIALGVDPEKIDEQRVLHALEMAQLGTWFSTLEDGLETEIMKGTAALSGGQKQRIGIARALYRETDMIILDEATSALDDVTENEILRIFDEALKDKTVIAVAHRLNTLRNCDRIIKLDKTGICFDGTWNEFQHHLTETHS